MWRRACPGALPRPQRALPDRETTAQLALPPPTGRFKSGPSRPSSCTRTYWRMMPPPHSAPHAPSKSRTAQFSKLGGGPRIPALLSRTHPRCTSHPPRDQAPHDTATAPAELGFCSVCTSRRMLSFQVPHECRACCHGHALFA